MFFQNSTLSKRIIRTIIPSIRDRNYYEFYLKNYKIIIIFWAKFRSFIWFYLIFNGTNQSQHYFHILLRYTYIILLWIEFHSRTHFLFSIEIMSFRLHLKRFNGIFKIYSSVLTTNPDKKCNSTPEPIYWTMIFNLFIFHSIPLD